MRPSEAFGARDQFVDARVVLHGAGAERIEAEINGVIPSGEAGEVAEGFELADFGKVFDFGADVALCREPLRRRRAVRRAEGVDSRSCQENFAQKERLVLNDVF